MRRQHLLAVLTCAIAASLCLMLGLPAAQAAIVIGKGADGVWIGSTEAQVKRAIGRPSAAEHEKGETVWRYYNRFDGVMGFKHKHVIGMWFTNKSQQTSKGISISSTVAQVQQAYPTATCTLGTGPGASPGQESESCTLKTTNHGRTIATTFEWRDNTGPMEEIDIGPA